LTELVLPLDEALALEVLDETVAAANRSEINTDEGRTGFEADVFKLFAAKNESRSVLAAQTLKNHFTRIVSLAAVYKWKAKALEQPAGKPKG
jgi:hypothetical protein